MHQSFGQARGSGAPNHEWANVSHHTNTMPTNFSRTHWPNGLPKSYPYPGPPGVQTPKRPPAPVIPPVSFDLLKEIPIKGRANADPGWNWPGGETIAHHPETPRRRRRRPRPSSVHFEDFVPPAEFTRTPPHSGEDISPGSSSPPPTRTPSPPLPHARTSQQVRPESPGHSPRVAPVIPDQDKRNRVKKGKGPSTQSPPRVRNRTTVLTESTEQALDNDLEVRLRLTVRNPSGEGPSPTPVQRGRSRERSRHSQQQDPRFVSPNDTLVEEDKGNRPSKRHERQKVSQNIVQKWLHEADLDPPVMPYDTDASQDPSLRRVTRVELPAEPSLRSSNSSRRASSQAQATTLRSMSPLPMPPRMAPSSTRSEARPEVRSDTPTRMALPEERCKRVWPDPERSVHHDLLNVNWDIRFPPSEARTRDASGVRQVDLEGPGTPDKIDKIHIQINLSQSHRRQRRGLPRALDHFVENWEPLIAVRGPRCSLSVEQILSVIRNYFYERLREDEIEWTKEHRMYSRLTDAHKARIRRGQWFTRGDTDALRRIDLLEDFRDLKFEGFRPSTPQELYLIFTFDQH
ncbi:hypothetical protein BKA70DRAFT_1247349 [Coprinopsis sp. MPI-PUGE-AT-0042]|nr:hypothetical protein BKA70DRAFT_1247349 [Coprinopsis sp. MPI-PUGE-AT-0042]